MKKMIIGGTLFALSVLLSSVAFPQSSGGDFVLLKSTIDNGGGTSTGEGFSLTGTIGQHDANGQSSGGDFLLAGGFWANPNDMMFRDGFESD
jgi:hypothetical protein